ncbi:hypothetical protein LZZ85_26490 [Terrimonas sp. NA20]|uniref:Uncharacterized protein n=1 Tax=Terrimonas ginsenosidimutans TaxID=2908004 RepID=A0ABS9L037_9BACT|nr:hypothetical protein [Terrimonas ginsenosidimutans]MCG2617878.1 hypothetical protein [Terrimonas ginsenosidimutans]
MKTSSVDHLANTWLLANLIQAVLLVAYAMAQLPMSYVLFPVILFCLAGLVFSIPAFVAGYFCLDLVADAHLPLNTRFLVWLIVCPTIVLVEGIICFPVFHIEGLSSLIFCAPGIAAAFLAVLFRYKAFIMLASRNERKEIT